MAKRLVERLKREGYDAEYVKFPVYDIAPTGPALNGFLRNGGAQDISEKELQLWFTLNRYQFQPTLKKWLDSGKIVVAEDYTGTGIAWGTVKGASTDWLESVNEELIREDLAILMDGERFREAEESGHIHESNETLMIRSREVHQMLGKRYGWITVPVVPGIEAMEALIWEQVQGKLPASE